MSEGIPGFALGRLELECLGEHVFSLLGVLRQEVECPATQVEQLCFFLLVRDCWRLRAIKLTY